MIPSTSGSGVLPDLDCPAMPMPAVSVPPTMKTACQCGPPCPRPLCRRAGAKRCSCAMCLSHCTEVGGCPFHPAIHDSGNHEGDRDLSEVVEHPEPPSLPAPLAQAADAEGSGYGDCIAVITANLATQGLPMPQLPGHVPSLQFLLHYATTTPARSLPLPLPHGTVSSTFDIPSSPSSNNPSFLGVLNPPSSPFEDASALYDGTFEPLSQFNDCPPTPTGTQPSAPLSEQRSSSPVTPTPSCPMLAPAPSFMRPATSRHSTCKQPRITNQLDPLWSEDLQQLVKQRSERDRISEQR
ncbi:hypothetical protein JVT61DRAFT_53 [Boletus reticuloceps]|uniref:Uncharacterized protein n=1 Tax=Boletus reticuloceps TaxID=495285 RepID=A0A8I2YXT7_9AGAM|nr:hypothetical protein JVT61DRAFT_53 [Boletus reticuloceps]